mgnify:CR=1 FL=1
MTARARFRAGDGRIAARARLAVAGPGSRATAGPTSTEAREARTRRAAEHVAPVTRKAQDTWSERTTAPSRRTGRASGPTAPPSTALKHSFEKAGNRWEPKDRKGPSNPQAARGGRSTRRSCAPTYGGVDVAGRTKDELLDLARRLDVPGRSSMTKDELGKAIARAIDRATAKARDQG